MGFYEKQQAMALKLITKYGQSLTLTVVTQGEYDPDTRLMGDPVPVDYPCKGIEEKYKLSDVDGTVIQTGDKKMIVAASGLAVRPMPKDLLIGTDDTWQVVDCEPLAPGGVPIIYTLQIRS